MKSKFKERQILFGAWTSLAHPSITEMFASIMKPDFVGIDVEHGTMGQEQCQRIIAAAQANGVPCIPRVASHNGEQIRRLLDSGADGIMVPSVSTRAEVSKIIEWCKYPPVGKRGYGVARGQGYGARFEEYTKTWNERSVLLIQIESIGAVDAVDLLLDCEEVDGVMVGPYDISGSLGIPGKITDPKVLKACDRVVAACKKFNKSCGTQIVVPTEKEIKGVFDAGYTFAVLASDIFLMWKWSEQMRDLIQKAKAEKR